MPSVNLKGMSFEKGLRIFRKKCMRAGIKREVRDFSTMTNPMLKEIKRITIGSEHENSTNERHLNSKQERIESHQTVDNQNQSIKHIKLRLIFHR